MSFYVSTATFFLLHCDEWDRVAALPRHKFVTGATLLQLDLDHSVNLIGHAAITEMIKLQFTTITDRIRNKIRNGNWFPKFSINRKEQKFLPICLRLLTLLTIIKDLSLRGLRSNQDRQKNDF